MIEKMVEKRKVEMKMKLIQKDSEKISFDSDLLTIAEWD